jgi:glycosyltransferase involved in cell wall biosynthesis
MALVSVVIPCFNATKYIPEALDSLRAQTFRDFEIILVNDGCPDTEALERVLERYRGEIRYLKSGAWASISGSRNNGIQASSARYIALLDADDMWEPDYLEVQVGILERDPSIALLYPDATYFGDGGSWVGKTFMEKNPTAGEVTMEKLISREISVFISVTARRENLLRAGLFDPQIRGGEDWDLWMRVARTGGKIAYHRRAVARYRLRQGSMSADKMDLLKNGLAVCGKHLQLGDISAEERVWFEACAAKYQANMYFVEAKQAVYAGRGADAAELFSKANRVLKNIRLTMAIVALRVAPGLVCWYVRRKYPTEYAYLH